LEKLLTTCVSDTVVLSIKTKVMPVVVAAVDPTAR
jgi:hypothetical protein